MSVCFGDFELDQERRQLLRSGRPVSLEPKAYELLILLVERRPRALSRAQIRDVVWPGVFISESTLNQAVNSIRRALDDDARQPRFLRTAHGFGYAFCEEARDTTEAEPRAGPTAREPESSPYPGLCSFTEADADLFFGRETETAALWEKIRRQKLLAVIGPSGVGKTSFLRAAVIPNRPQGWAAASATPGSSPALALALALTPELAGDAQAVEGLLRGVQDLSRSDDPSSLLSAITRWRGGGEQALLVVDQFEELFTLNPPEVQRRFAQLLGQLAEADVHILLSLRDDFLFRCSEHESLRPVFLDLTPLRPPPAEALRRALVEPAQGRGFEFEEERLVEDMVETVRDERAALPLLAFAASRLWDERDRERKLLTRSAYERIGGVAGSLAQHAEATLQGVGPERENVVREIFRNLVTAEGTRSVVDREEVLSVFNRRDREHVGAASEGDGRQEAEDVLDALVDARLLTEYEAVSPRAAADAPGEGPGTMGPGSGVGHRRIEIVHESLLEAWPRLVLWRAQEAEGAVLRDQLKQAARLWEEKGRPDELLWTGPAYEECRLWQTRYSGGLTATDEAFTTAMAAMATRSKRQRRFAVGAAVALALGVAAITSFLWQRSETAEQQARDAARHAEAGRLVLLGRAQLEEDPSAALAYAVASLEQADSPEARRLAVELLGQGPTRFQLTSQGSWGAVFSPDGRWLARWGPERVGTLELWPRDGGPPKAFPGEFDARFQLGPRSELFMISRSHPVGSGAALRIYSAPDWRLIRTLTFEGDAGPFTSSVPVSRLVTAIFDREGGSRFQSWPFEGGEPTDLGHLDSTWVRGWVTGDASGRWLGYVDRENRILVVPSDRIGTASARLVERRENVGFLAFSPDAARLASYSESGEIRLHALAGGAPPRIIRGPRPQGDGNRILGFSPDGSTLVAGLDRVVRLWNLGAPLEAEPVALRGERVQTNGASFEPSGQWLATAGVSHVSIWPLRRRYPRVLRAHAELVTTLAFDPRGRWLVSGSLDDSVRLWSLREDSGGPSRLLFRDETKSGVVDVGVDPDGRRVLVGCQYGPVWVVPVDGGRPRLLGRLGRVHSVAFSPDGRLAAASGLVGEVPDPSGLFIRVWDLESGRVRDLYDGDRGDRGERTILVGIRVQFTHDGRIASSGDGGVRLWDVEAGTHEVLHATSDRFTESPLSSRLCAGRADEPTAWSCYDLQSARPRAVQTMSHSSGPLGFFTLSPDGGTLVSGDHLGVIRAGPVTGEPPHLLLGHAGAIRDIAVSPDGQWVASAGEDGTVRLWPMPDVTEPPLHTLPHEVLLEKLRSLTNLRVVEDKASSGDYRVDAGPFPGWKTVPTW